MTEREQELQDEVDMLRGAVLHLLEVQVRPSSEFADEWRAGVIECRKALRFKGEVK